MVQVGRALTLAAALLVALLAALSLPTVSWAVGLGCGLLVTLAVARAAPDLLGPADLVTLARALLACVVAALVAEARLGQPVTAVLVGLVPDLQVFWASAWAAQADDEVHILHVSVAGRLIARILHPAEGLQQRGGAEIAV